jgi:HEAT repeat protein
VALLLYVAVSPQAGPQVLPPLPAVERIAGALPLNVTLRLGAGRVAIGDVPTFTVVVRNDGRAPLLLNPGAVSNIEIFTQSGELVPPARGGIAEHDVRRLKPSDFIPLGPGQTHEFAVEPAYHSLGDHSAVGMYVDASSRSERRLTLPAGNYSVRLTYLAFPDYAASRYDAAEVADVWEGLAEAPAVPLTVLPPSEDDVRDAIAKIEGDGRALAAIDLARLGRVTRAIDPLLRVFARSYDMRVAEALMSIDAERAAPGVVAAIAGSPAREREAMVTTRVFAHAARASPDCAAVPLVIEATGYASTDIVAVFDDSFRGFADKCPDLRTGLITLLRTPAPVAAAYQRSAIAYSRRRAAEALGRIGNPDDVPLLVAVLRRDVVGLPPYGDPAREGAVRALGRLGGAQAAAALFEQLNDPVGNRLIMPVIVEELGRLNPPGTAAALARLLDSSDQPSVLVRVLITLGQLRATSTVPRVRAMLSHSNSTVRVSASRALLDLGGAVTPLDMRSALDDPDGNVRANVLFHLARHGDATSLPLFVRGLTSDVQFVGEASVEGIARFGTRDTFAPLRAALDRAGERGAPYVAQALKRLTFAPIWEAQTLTEWDEWWKAHARTTRLQWAQDALDASLADRNAGRAELAARYLTNVQPSPRALVERSLSHPSWRVRDAAVAAVQAYDRPRAAGLLLRELDSRYLGACRNAVRRLSALTGEKETFDCMLPADRQRARVHWTSLAGRGAR